MSADHGTFSGIKGVTRAKQAKSIEREIDKALAAIDAEAADRAAEHKALRAAKRAAEAARVKFTAALCLCAVVCLAIPPALRAWVRWLDDKAALAGSIWAFTDDVIPQAGPDFSDLPDLKDNYFPTSEKDCSA